MEFAARTMGALLPKLLLLLREEYHLQKSVKEGIRFLIAELESMQAALEKVSVDVPADQLDKQLKLWARDVREMSYDIEDSVDTFMVRLDSKKEAKPHHVKGFIDRALYQLSKVRIRHKLAADMKSIKCLVREVKERRDRYKIDNIVTKPAVTAVDPRLSALFKSVSELVGIDKAMDELTMMLSRGDGVVSTNRLKIISVVGVGGLGKTTLAKAVYDKLKVQYRCSAFISIGQNPNVKNVLKDILLELDRQKYENIHSTLWDETQLIKLLHEFLTSKRYFIVIDDIWDIHSWEITKLALLENNCGSRIIVTTRKLEIGSEAGDVYNLEPLTYDNSNKLFYTRIFGEGKYPENQPDELPEKILKKCGGIPLAIITMASLLSSKPRDQWFEVYSSIGFRQAENTMRILSLSYYDMPLHLRTCLLYLSVFPEDYVIMKESLIWKWIAEGFVHRVQGIGLFELGERYFNELINRNMIQPVEHVMYPSVVYGCRLHDMVFDLIRSLSEEENFVTTMNNEYGTSPHGKVRRISQQDRNEDHNPDVPIDLTHVRSFIACSCNISMLASLSRFHVLRVLALEQCHCKEGVVEHFLVTHVGTLHHLRYLGLAGTLTRELPEEVGALKFLQTLDLSDTGVIELPSSIGQLTKLMRLRCDYNCTEIPANGVIGKLTSLEELKIYPGRVAFNETESELTRRFVKDLSNLTELRVLDTTINVLDNSLEEALLESVRNLHKLRDLVIHGYSSGIHSKWEAARLVVPRHLRVLSLGGLRFSSLPAWFSNSVFPNLSYLQVNVLCLDHKDMRILGLLPELCFLQVCTSSVVAVYGDDGCFRKLRSCRLETDDPVIFRGGRGGAEAMPGLEILELDVHGQGWKDFCVHRGQNISATFLSAVICLHNLPLLRKVCVNIMGCITYGDQVLLRHVVNSHHNHPTFETALYSCEADQPCIDSRKIVSVQVPVCATKDIGFGFNFTNLASLEKVTARINCEYATPDLVEQAEAGLRHAVDDHLNHPTLEMQRYGEYVMEYQHVRKKTNRSQLVDGYAAAAYTGTNGV